jgi:metal-responsive CopG/Arc/MetJ family transcriptional regulator
LSKSPLVLVQVKFPKDLLKQIDARSKVKGDRSQFIRDACHERLVKLRNMELEEAHSR